jgi:hypothetical protein
LVAHDRQSIARVPIGTWIVVAAIARTTKVPPALGRAAGANTKNNFVANGTHPAICIALAWRRGAGASRHTVGVGGARRRGNRTINQTTIATRKIKQIVGVAGLTQLFTLRVRNASQRVCVAHIANPAKTGRRTGARRGITPALNAWLGQGAITIITTTFVTNVVRTNATKAAMIVERALQRHR